MKKVYFRFGFALRMTDHDFNWAVVILAAVATYMLGYLTGGIRIGFHY